MMNHVLKGISFVFHPILMPLLGVALYLSKTPRFIPDPVIKAKLFSITILTVILPILLYFLLKTLNKVESIHLETTKERIFPLLLSGLITVIIITRVITHNEIVELYYFFIGVLFSTIACLILAILKFKASLHMVAAAGFFMFAIAISIHFQININGTLALLCIMLGAIATSRLHLKAHTIIELILGFFVGLIPQLLVLNYWL